MEHSKSNANQAINKILTTTTMSDQQGKTRNIIDNNKENIPRSKDKSIDETPSSGANDDNADLSGFVPVVSHKKKQKDERPTDDKKFNEPRSRSNRNKDRSSKPKQRKSDGKTTKANTNNDSSQSNNNSADEEVKKVKFVEAPLPQNNPWMKSSENSSKDLKKDAPKPIEKSAQKQQKPTVSLLSSLLSPCDIFSNKNPTSY
jgi:hypothetical protein